MVPETWSTKEKIVSHFGPFLPFNLTNNPKNQNFKTNEKNSWRYHHFTHVYQKLGSDDVQFLRYDAEQADGQTDGQKK